MKRTASDVLIDSIPTRAGITEFIEAAALADAFHVRLSAHTAPSIHAHLCCAVPAAVHVEYFHDHVRIEQLLFEGFTRPVNGVLYPDPSRPGLGLEFKGSDAARYAA